MIGGPRPDYAVKIGRQAAELIAEKRGLASFAAGVDYFGVFVRLFGGRLQLGIDLIEKLLRLLGVPLDIPFVCSWAAMIFSHACLESLCAAAICGASWR